MAISFYSGVGYVVLDCFMGSGTTAKVAKTLNRKYLGFEINKEYCELSKEIVT